MERTERGRARCERERYSKVRRGTGTRKSVGTQAQGGGGGRGGELTVQCL